jgi:hypothetical protein
MALLPPLLPTEVGQRVRTTGHGGGVSLWMETGTVVRFTRAGNPVVAVDACGGYPATTVTDRASNFRRITDEGRWLYPPESD